MGRAMSISNVYSPSLEKSTHRLSELSRIPCYVWYSSRVDKATYVGNWNINWREQTLLREGKYYTGINSVDLAVDRTVLNGYWAVRKWESTREIDMVEREGVDG
jgi:hypothetical protein